MHLNKKSISTLFIILICVLLLIPFFHIVIVVQAVDIGLTEKWYFKIRDYAPSDHWAYNSSFTSLVIPVAANLDEDDYLEVIFSAGYRTDDANRWGIIICVDGNTGIEQWNISEENLGGHACVEIAEIDGDPYPEAVICGYHEMKCINAENGTQIWNYSSEWRMDRPLIIANIGGTIFVYHELDVPNGADPWVRKVYATNGTLHTQILGPQDPCNGGLSAADINNDGKLEIIISSTTQYGDGLQCYDEDLNLVWAPDEMAVSGGTTPIIDVDGDGFLDVVGWVCSCGNGWLGIIDGEDGSHMTDKWHGSDQDMYTHDGPTVGDADGDGDIEVFMQRGSDCVAGEDQIQVYDISNWQWETNLTETNVSNTYSNPVIANVYGDTGYEILHSCGGTWAERGLRIWSGDGTFLQTDTIFYGKYFTVNDIDNDGKNEIYGQATRDGSGGFVQCIDTDGATLGARTDSMYYSERRQNIEVYIPSLLFGPDYYVNGTSGSDSNNGSLSAPFLTIQKAVNETHVGGTVYIMAGEYNEVVDIVNNGSAGNIITIRNYQSDEVIINGHGQLDSGYDGIIHAQWKHHYRITGLTLRNGSYGDGSGTGSNQAYGILWRKSTTTDTISDITLDNLTIYNFTNAGIHIVRNSPYDGSWINNVIIENNTIYDTCNWPKGRTDPGGAPVNAANEGISILGAQNVTIQYNYVYQCGKECIDIKAKVKNCVVRYNKVNATNSNDNATQDNPSNIGIYLDGISDLDEIEVYNNAIWGNGTGMQVSVEGTGTVTNIDFYNNICNMSGVDHPYSFTISNSNYAIDQISIINNMFYSIGDTSVKIDEDEGYLTNIIFRNNIVVSDQYYEMRCVALDQADLSIDNNSFWDVDGSEIKTDWQTDNSDYHGDDNITSDPEFFDVITGKFWLNNTSPCIDNGSSISAPSFDYNNTARPQNSLYDIGAFEYAGSGNPPTQSGESPNNGSTGIILTPDLYVICTDAYNDIMTATWRSNSSGVWVDFATTTGISTGTNITQPNNNFSTYSTTYYWSVHLTDGTNWNNETYHFTTLSESGNDDPVIEISVVMYVYNYEGILVNNALVTIYDGTDIIDSGFTDDGIFEANIGDGIYTIVIIAEGYNTLTDMFIVDDDETLSFFLTTFDYSAFILFGVIVVVAVAIIYIGYTYYYKKETRKKRRIF